MLIDMHAHSSGISKCCRADYRTLLDLAKETGLDGIILTNHYASDYLDGTDVAQFVEKYIEECHLSAAYAAEIGCKSFFGIEVTMEFDRRVHLLIYGVSEDFLRENPYLFNLSLEELYALVHQNGGILVQAHPFRNGTTILDPNHLDGIEINCHPKYGSAYSDEILKFAKEHHLLVTCGADYHYDVPYRPNCGVHFPDHLDMPAQLILHLLDKSAIYLRVQELYESDYYEHRFTK